MSKVDEQVDYMPLVVCNTLLMLEFHTEMKKSPPVLAYLALGFGVIALSLTSIFVRWANAPGTVTSMYRMGLAAVVLFPFFLRRTKKFGLPRGKVWWWVAAGGLLVGLDHGLLSTAVNFTRIANSTLMNNLASLWVALFAFFIWREKLTHRFWLGLACCLVGAVIVLGGDIGLGRDMAFGNTLAVLSGLAYAAYFLVTQRGRAGLDTLGYMVPVDIISALALLGFNLTVANPLTGFDWRTWGAFLGAGLLSQTLGYSAIGYALGHLPASVVSATLIAQPVLTTLLAIPLTGESLKPAQWLGGAAVVAGIAVINFWGKDNPRSTNVKLKDRSAEAD
jgi:drug/metabolite transporter (DMT)-like permease